LIFNEWSREIWKYREVFYIFVWRDIKIRYKQTVLGALWAVIQPLFTMVVFTVFFGKLGKMPSEDIPYPVFSYSALVPWTFFASSLSLTGNCLVTNAPLLRKIYFPRITLPASNVFTGIIDFAIASVILFFLLAYYRIPASWSILLWPALMIPLVFLVLGLGMFLASINVKYRDIKHAIPFAIQILLFLTPIIYPMSIIPEKYRYLLALNPLTGLIEAFRSSLLPSRPIDVTLLLVSLLLTSIIFVVGFMLFRKTERTFADIV
jgi:lipopolysaccharide transport system permease protein